MTPKSNNGWDQWKNAVLQSGEVTSSKIDKLSEKFDKFVEAHGGLHLTLEGRISRQEAKTAGIAILISTLVTIGLRLFGHGG